MRGHVSLSVIPAHAGIHGGTAAPWIPAFAGMTKRWAIEWARALRIDPRAHPVPAGDDTPNL